MSRVSELIDLIVQNKNAEASEVLNQELMNRSYEGINELKPQVANDYFASVIDMPNDGQPLEYSSPEPEEEPTNEAD
jgi:hypothetical protein